LIAQYTELAIGFRVSESILIVLEYDGKISALATFYGKTGSFFKSTEFTSLYTWLNNRDAEFWNDSTTLSRTLTITLIWWHGDLNIQLR
jgi:hypothetical protein